MYLKAPLSYIIHHFYGIEYFLYADSTLKEQIYSYISKKLNFDSSSNIQKCDIEDIACILSGMHMQDVRNIYRHFVCGRHYYIFDYLFPQLSVNQENKKENRKEIETGNKKENKKERYFKNYKKICDISYRYDKVKVVQFLLNDIVNFIDIFIRKNGKKPYRNEIFYLMFLSVYVNNSNGIAALLSEDSYSMLAHEHDDT